MEYVERHIIKRSNKLYKFLDSLCFKSKNLYNHANYLLRQELNNNQKILCYQDLDKLLKNDKQYPDYRDQPTAQCAQQVLRVLSATWKGFFKANKDYKNNPSKYNGRPKLPNYLNKTKGRFPVIFTNQMCKLKNKIIYFPKTMNGFKLHTKVNNFQQVRIIPKGFCIIIEVVYKINKSTIKLNSNNMIGIDIGLDNLAAVVNNCGLNVFLVNGKGLKSINQFYNKKVAYYTNILERVQHCKMSNRLKRFYYKRFTKINDFLHKASRCIINYCIQHDIGTIIIGKNNNWKQNVNLGSITNQNFTSIPYYKFLQMLKYKAEFVNIDINFIEESYTSGTSFLDNELPNKQFYNKTRRKYRGLFISNKGIKINADINAAFQILNKFTKGACDISSLKKTNQQVEGLVLNPFMVTIL